MPSNKLPLIFPFGGRSDSSAFHDQSPLTTREATNVRVKDPRTGRMRGAQRSGLTQVVAPTSTKIREMCSLKYALNEGVDYAYAFNILQNGGDFTATEWAVVNGCVVTASVTADPFGGNNGTRLDDTDGVAESYLEYTLAQADFPNGPAGAPLFYRFSGFIKQDTALNTAIEYRQVAPADNVQRASFLWASETLTLTDAGGIAPGTTGAITQISGGWWRIDITFPHVDGSTGHLIRLIPDSTSAASTGESFFYGGMLSRGTTLPKYTADVVIPWSDEVGKNAVHVDVDRQGNVFFLFSPGTLIKYNPDGVRLAEFSAVPDDPAHTCRALYVDPVLNCIFLGVSSGGDVETAKFWFILSDEDGNLSAPHSTTPGYFIEEIRVVRDKLYVAGNNPTTAQAVVLVYEGITANAPPVLVATHPAPFPINGLDIDNEGEMFVASGTDTTHLTASGSPPQYIKFRGIHPAEPNFRPVMIGDWTPVDLDNAESRIWFWWRARDITTADTAGSAAVTPGVEVVTMRDRSGQNRHMTAATPPGGSADLGATYREQGGIPSLQFTGIEGYRSGLNTTTTNAAGGSQNTMLPAYAGVDLPLTTGGVFALFITCRPTESLSRKALFYQPSDTSPSTEGHMLFVNRQCGEIISTPTIGYLSYFAQTGGVAGVDVGACGAGPFHLYTGIFPTDLSWTAESEGTDAVIITVVWDGGTSEATAGPATGKTRSLVRLNGRPLDRALGKQLLTSGSSRTEFGFYTGSGSSAATNYIGEVYEVLVLDRKTRGMSEATDDGTNLILTHQAHPDIATGAQTVNEMTQIEGYMAHGVGLGHLLDNETETYPHPYGLKASSTNGASSIMGPPNEAETGAEALAALNIPSTTKIKSTGKKAWTYNNETETEGVLANEGGAGHAVRVKDGDVYSLGPQADEMRTVSDQKAYARKIIDKGDTFSDSSADGAWSRGGGFTLDFATQKARIDVDKFGTVYIPVAQNTASSLLDVLDSTGAEILRLIPGTTQIYMTCAHHDSRIPDYGTDVIGLARSMYAGFADLTAGNTLKEARKFFLVDATVTDQAQTRTVNLYAQGQDLRTFTIGGSTTLVSAGLFNAAGSVFCVPTRNEVVLIDGSTYQVYSGPDATVSVLTSTSPGDIPLNARFGVFWRSRLLLAGFPDVGAKLVGSAIGDIRNWDIAPPREELGSAFLLSLNEVDEAPPDVITGLIDARDDLLIVGGSRTMTRLTGDPLSGGQFHNLSTEIGMAWGNAWTKDPQGRIYFFGTNPPGLYGVGEGGGIAPLTQGTLEDSEFQAIDFSTVRIKLLWNPRDEGIHIFQFPFGAGGSIRRAWFWEYKTHDLVQRPPIWPDVFGVSGVQPTAGVVLEGLVQNERRLMLGCEDGGLRVWDAAASSDDGNAIDSNVLFPPVTKQSIPRSLALRGLKVFLGTDNDGCLVQYYGANEADRLGREVQEFQAHSGENPTFRRRVRGNNIFVRFRNARNNEFWAYENSYLKLARSQKPRSGR